MEWQKSNTVRAHCVALLLRTAPQLAFTVRRWKSDTCALAAAWRCVGSQLRCLLHGTAQALLVGLFAGCRQPRRIDPFSGLPFGPSAILSQAALVAIPYAHLLERCRAAAAKPSAAGVAEKGVLRGSLIGAAADGLKGQPYRPSLIGLGLGAPNPRGSDGRSAAAPKAQQREGPAGARQVAAPPGTLSKSQVPTANRVAC